MKILIVEDDPDDALLVKKMFDKAWLQGHKKFELWNCYSINEALIFLKTKEIDGIVLDLGLPDSTGIDTFHKLKESGKDIPVIVLTGMEDEAVAMDSLKAGAQDYLVKGEFESSLLIKALKYAIERHGGKKELDGLKEEFAAILTHDLKSPLTSIMGYAELLIDTQTGVANEYSRNIYKEGELMMELINNIVTASNIESGKISFKFEDFKLNDLFDELKITFEPLSIKKQIKLDFSCPELCLVFADRLRMLQVFHNLISNAFRYTPDGGTISVLVTAQDKRIFIEVSDSGSGILESEQPKLFKKFKQIKGSRHGTGLGLYIVKNFLNGHESDIYVESEPGKGTKFYFSLPKSQTKQTV